MCAYEQIKNCSSFLTKRLQFFWLPNRLFLIRQLEAASACGAGQLLLCDLHQTFRDVAADVAGFARRKVAVVVRVKLNTQFLCDFKLHLIKCCFCLLNYQLIVVVSHGMKHSFSVVF